MIGFYFYHLYLHKWYKFSLKITLSYWFVIIFFFLLKKVLNMISNYSIPQYFNYFVSWLLLFSFWYLLFSWFLLTFINIVDVCWFTKTFACVYFKKTHNFFFNISHIIFIILGIVNKPIKSRVFCRSFLFYLRILGAKKHCQIKLQRWQKVGLRASRLLIYQINSL